MRSQVTLESPQSRPASGRVPLPSLTGLRFLAALHVLLFHAQGTFPNAALFQLPSPFAHWFGSGYVGVSLFFILSGFILAYNYLETDLARPERRVQFWISRLARVYPIYLLGLAVAAPKFIHACLEPESTSSLLGNAAAAGAVVSLTQAWSPGHALTWNAPGWSLSVEAFFYLLFPLLAIRVARMRRQGAIIGLTSCWVVSLLPPVLYYSLAPESALWANVVKFNPLVRLPEFVLGICLGRLFITELARSRPTRHAEWRPSWIVGFIVLVLLFHDRVPKLFVHNALMAPLFAWLIYALARQDRLKPGSTPGDRLAGLLRRPSLALLGEASYALYILHVPIKGLLMFGADRIVGATGLWGTSVLFAAYLLVTLAAAVGAFKYVEVPARRWIKGWLGPAAEPSPAMESCLAQPARNLSL